MRQVRGQCGRARPEKSARDGIYCREDSGVAGAKSPVLLAFLDGTAFADPPKSK
jgi:hypothetical protein